MLKGAEQEFFPAGSIGPEIELVFDESLHPFQEPFQDEEVIADRYPTTARAPESTPAPPAPLAVAPPKNASSWPDPYPEDDPPPMATPVSDPLQGVTKTPAPPQATVSWPDPYPEDNPPPMAVPSFDTLPQAYGKVAPQDQVPATQTETPGPQCVTAAPQSVPKSNKAIGGGALPPLAPRVNPRQCGDKLPPVPEEALPSEPAQPICSVTPVRPRAFGRLFAKLRQG